MNLLSIFLHPRLALLLAVAAILTGCRGAIKHGDGDLPNFQSVNESLFRGGQPTREGLERAERLGVKTVVNVRGSDTDRANLHGLDLDYEHRAMAAWRPSDADVIWFLAIATDPQRAPVFLHCKHGADRTGYLTAMYRIVVDGWDRERAIAEMTSDGNGFHPLYQNLIAYVRHADVERIRIAVDSAREARQHSTMLGATR